MKAKNFPTFSFCMNAKQKCVIYEADLGGGLMGSLKHPHFSGSYLHCIMKRTLKTPKMASPTLQISKFFRGTSDPLYSRASQIRTPSNILDPLKLWVIQYCATDATLSVVSYRFVFPKGFICDFRDVIHFGNSATLESIGQPEK